MRLGFAFFFFAFVIAAGSHTVVDAVGARAAANGGEIESGPKEYYAVFLDDPDGIKLEIIHRPGGRAGPGDGGAGAHGAGRGAGVASAVSQPSQRAIAAAIRSCAPCAVNSPTRLMRIANATSPPSRASQ